MVNISNRFFKPLKYEKQIRENVDGKYRRTGNFENAIFIYGKIEKNIKSSDNSTKNQFDNILYCRRSLNLGDKVEGMEIVHIMSFGKYMLK